MAGLAIGFLMLGAQLWLLTVALELLYSGHSDAVWLCALTSGGIFAGGLFVRWVLGRRPRLQRLTTDESGRMIRREEPI